MVCVEPHQDEKKRRRMARFDQVWRILQSPWSILAGMIAEAVMTGYVTMIIHAHILMAQPLPRYWKRVFGPHSQAQMADVGIAVLRWTRTTAARLAADYGRRVISFSCNRSAYLPRVVSAKGP